MDETTLRNLLGGALAGEPPTGPVGHKVLRAGIRLRRRRRAMLAAVPVLAAATAVAVGLTAGAAAPPRPAAVAPRQFSPLIPYASFGWLPAGNKIVDGGVSPRGIYVVGGPSLLREPWQLSAYAAGQCHLIHVRYLKGRYLNCPGGSTGPLLLTGRARGVHTYRAYWAGFDNGIEKGHALAWQYARGGWAILDLWPWLNSLDSRWRADAVKVADHARFGAHATPPLAFPVRLTAVPASWRVVSVDYRPEGTLLQAREWSVSTAPASARPGPMLPFPSANGFSFTTEVAAPRSGCIFAPHGMSARRVINGYHVVLSRPPARLTVKLTRRQIPWRNAPRLCAAHANGLRVQIDETGKPVGLSVVSLFAHHLQLLGTNPANWAKSPIG